LLGNMDATKFAIGDVFGPQITHMTRTKVGRGFTVANTPIGNQSEFDRISARILSHHWGRFMCGPI
jgi:hypothetical protein